MTPPRASIAERHPVAVFVETAIFVAYFAAFLFMARLESSASTWSMLPHLLVNASLLVLVVKRVREGRPPLYWGHFDLMVGVLFLYIAANVYYSEVRGVSWREAALYLDAFGAYLLGRMLFFRRIRLFMVGTLVMLAVAFVSAHFMLGPPPPGAEPPSELLVARLEGLQGFALVFGAFIALSLPFLWLRKPANLVFLLYTALALGLYALFMLQYLGWLFEPGDTAAAVEMRHARHLSLETVWNIVRAYPLAGGGVGTFPILFSAFKPSPAAPFSANFTSYIYVLVELGVIGLLHLLYVQVRVPLYIVRRWRLFPNRQLRMAVVVFFAMALMVLVHGLVDPGMFAPAVWLVVWAAMGILMSLVMVRDPVRIFEMPFDVRRPAPSSGDGADAPRPGLTRHLGNTALVAGAALLLGALTLLEAAPYHAERLSRLKPGEELASEAHGRRLERAVRVFPLLPELWIRMANHYQAVATDPLAMIPYLPRIEQAYQRAVALNPYVTRSYSLLYDLHIRTNDSAKAQETLKRGVRNNPNDLILRLMLVRELERAGSLDLAIWHVRQALFRIAPDRTELLIRLAELYELRGMNEQAIRYYQYARQVVPNTPQVEGRMRRLRENLGIAE